MMKKFFVRCLSLALTIVSVFSLFTVFAPTASAATTYTQTVKDGIYTLASEAFPAYRVNVWGGANGDGIKVTLYRRDGTVDQQIYISYQGDGKYLIYAVCSGNSRVIDVYHGGSGKLKAGQKIDIWRPNDPKAQLVYIEKVGSNQYVFRLCSNPKLVISAQKGSNGSRLILANYKKGDSKQIFRFYSSNGKTAVDPTYKAPANADSKTRFVQSVEMVRTSLFSVAQSKYDAARTSLDVAVSWTECTKYAELLGSNGTQAIKLCLNGWRLRYDQCIENVIDAAANCVNPDAYATVLALDLSRDAYDSGVQAFKTVSKYKNKQVTTYAEATEFYNAFLSCYANFEASLYITTPIVQTANRTSSGFAHTFKNLAKGIGHSIMPDAGYGDELISIFEGVNSIKEVNEALGITNAYNKAYATAKKMFPAL